MRQIVVVISNTGPLVALTRVGALDLIFKLFGVDKVFVPQEVIDEIKYPEHVKNEINSYIEKSKILVLPPTPEDATYSLQVEIAMISIKPDPKQRLPKQHKAEACAIGHALQQKDSILLIDDGSAISVAREKGVQYMRHLTIIKKCVENGRISEKEGLEIVNNLEEKGYKYANLNKLKERWKNG